MGLGHSCDVATHTHNTHTHTATATPPGNGTAGSGNFTVCTSPATYPALADGWYTWWLGATDLAGNTAQPSNSTFLVDTKPPAVTLQCPGATQASSFVVSWNANDGNGSGIASTQCKYVVVVVVMVMVVVVVCVKLFVYNGDVLYGNVPTMYPPPHVGFSQSC